MAQPDLHVHTVPQLDPRLGRQVVHDERSRGFALPGAVDRASWRTRTLRVYDPQPNPNQPIGCCTGVSKAVQFNTAGHRTTGRVYRLDDAIAIYSAATRLDPWPGNYPPTDTGSSGLAAAKAAQQLGLGGEYRWIFNGADGVVQAIVDGWPVSLGTWWYQDMFDRDARGAVSVSGAQVGGHQWTGIGYDARTDEVIGLCWWGPYRTFRIARTAVADLLADRGDAHIQEHVA